MTKTFDLDIKTADGKTTQFGMIDNDELEALRRYVGTRTFTGSSSSSSSSSSGGGSAKHTATAKPATATVVVPAAASGADGGAATTSSAAGAAAAVAASSSASGETPSSVDDLSAPRAARRNMNDGESIDGSGGDGDDGNPEDSDSDDSDDSEYDGRDDDDDEEDGDDDNEGDAHAGGKRRIEGGRGSGTLTEPHAAHADEDADDDGDDDGASDDDDDDDDDDVGDDDMSAGELDALVADAGGAVAVSAPRAKRARGTSDPPLRGAERAKGSDTESETERDTAACSPGARKASRVG